MARSLEERKHAKLFTEESRTKQAFKDECDINKIVARYKKQTGIDLAQQFAPFTGGEFGDFSDVVDYHTAMDRIIQAEANFEALPAILRKRFGNDPGHFVDFMTNPENADEIVKMGLGTKRELGQPSQEKINAEGGA